MVFTSVPGCLQGYFEFALTKQTPPPEEQVRGSARCIDIVLKTDEHWLDFTGAFIYDKHDYCCVITSSLWASRKWRILRAAKPVSSTLKPHKAASSGFPSAAAQLAGSEVAAEESDPLLPAEAERRESRAWQNRDRWRSNRGRRRTAPGHDLHTDFVFSSEISWTCPSYPYAYCRKQARKNVQLTWNPLAVNCYVINCYITYLIMNVTWCLMLFFFKEFKVFVIIVKPVYGIWENLCHWDVDQLNGVLLLSHRRALLSTELFSYDRFKWVRM